MGEVVDPGAVVPRGPEVRYRIPLAAASTATKASSAHSAGVAIARAQHRKQRASILTSRSRR
jgi:hypothetical protein